MSKAQSEPKDSGDPWPAIHAQAQSGAVAEARSMALAAMMAKPSDPATQLTFANFVVHRSLFQDFPQARAILEALQAKDPENQTILRLLAYVLWTSGEGERAIETAYRHLMLAPRDSSLLRWLGSYCLTSGRYREALLALTAAAVQLPDEPSLWTAAELARRLASGERAVVAQLGGIQVRFELTAANGQLMSSDLVHVSGELGEAEELTAIYRLLDPGGVFVEVGLLVGNHLLFLAKALRPTRIVGFEGDRRNLDLVERNLACNRSAEPAAFAMEVVLHHAMVGARDLPPAGAGAPAQVTLDRALADEPRVDFLKVDVDGMELDVLQGMRATLAKHRPIVMIEVEALKTDEARAMLSHFGYAVIGKVDHHSYANWIVAPEDRAPAFRARAVRNQVPT